MSQLFYLCHVFVCLLCKIVCASINALWFSIMLKILSSQKEGGLEGLQRFAETSYTISDVLFNGLSFVRYIWGVFIYKLSTANYVVLGFPYNNLPVSGGEIGFLKA